MIIDIHAHFTAPEALYAYKANFAGEPRLGDVAG